MSFAQHNDFNKRMQRIQSGKGFSSGVVLIGEGNVKKTAATKATPRGPIAGRRQNPFKLPGALLIGAGAVLAGQKLLDVILAGTTPIPPQIITQVTDKVDPAHLALGAGILIAVLARIFLRLETKLQTLALVASFGIMAFQPQLVSDAVAQVTAMISSQLADAA